MTIPASPPISLDTVRTELGGSLPFSMSSVLGTMGLPGSPPLSLSDCLGRSAAVVFTPLGSTNSGAPEVINNGYPSEDVTCSGTATWTWSLSGSGTSSIVSGGTGTLITLSCDGAPGAFRQCTFTLTGAGAGNTRYFSVICTNDQT